MTDALLAIDQGTTSTRSILFDTRLSPIATAQVEFTQHYPAPGHVEHDPDDIWQTTIKSARTVIANASKSPSQIAAIGITNQRETTIVWNRKSGTPIHNAIVWQDRRTAEICARLRRDGHETMVRLKTGLLIDPYFSATKIAWILDNVAGARAAANAGQLAFGTIETFLLWRLTNGRTHATDATNAARTMLLDIHTGHWDDDLLRLFNIPRSLLPVVRDCSADFGSTSPELFGAPIKILGMAGDQQAATVGQGCIAPGMMKATYGTGCFALLNIGHRPILSTNRLLTTIAYQLDGRRTYALEGSIFVAGAAVQWLRDGLGVIRQAADTDTLAAQSDPAAQVYMVPAFVGLGAPWWDADARGSIFGLTRNSGPAELARAALEAAGYQTRDLLEAMRADWPTEDKTVLRVDGGMTASAYAMQFLANILDAPVDRPTVMETTALGAAYLAGRKAGLTPDLEDFANHWQLERRFEPTMDTATRTRKWAGWRDAVERTLTRRTPMSEP
jgi:glycerol kinase